MEAVIQAYVRHPPFGHSIFRREYILTGFNPQRKCYSCADVVSCSEILRCDEEIPTYSTRGLDRGCAEGVLVLSRK